MHRLHIFYLKVQHKSNICTEYLQQMYVKECRVKYLHCYFTIMNPTGGPNGRYRQTRVRVSERMKL